MFRNFICPIISNYWLKLLTLSLKNIYIFLYKTEFRSIYGTQFPLQTKYTSNFIKIAWRMSSGTFSFSAVSAPKILQKKGNLRV